MNTPIPTVTSPFVNLPDLMKQLLLHEDNTDINIEIKNKNHLVTEQNSQMMNIIRRVILKKINPANLIATIKKDIQLDEQKAKKLALDLLGRRFLPMQWYIGNVEGLIKELGGDLAKYESEARKNYPEVYTPDAATETTDTASVIAVPSFSRTSSVGEPAILHDIAEKLASPKGRATVLLRLTALSLQIEEAGKSGLMTADETTKLLHVLDTLSYSINTQDLNPLEIGAIKRRLKKIIAKVKS